MNETPHTTPENKKPQREHGTTQSYIIGFVLSLIFTAIPYYLVVNKTVTGDLLLATILGFAILQMLVQIIFFLHLGRGPKPLYNIAFFVSTAGIILVVTGGSVFIMSQLHYNMAPRPTAAEASQKLVEDEGIYQVGGEQTGACRGVHTNHKITLNSGAATPAHTTAHACDTLTFINEDGLGHTIMFGLHPNHEVYSGNSSLTIAPGHPKTITLNQSGTYQFHDELHLQATGDFTAAP